MLKRRMNQCNLHDLFYSLIHGELSALDQYISNGGTLKLTGPDRKSLLIGCIEENQEEVFNRLLELGVDVDLADDQGMTAMHWAANKGTDHCVRCLLAHGVALDKQDNEGRTGLMLAVSGDYLDVVKRLLQSGCDLSKANEDGFTALHIASEQGKLETVELLLQNGSDTFLRTVRGHTPLSLALSNKDLKTVHMILEHNGRSCEGSVYSPDLHMVVKRRYSDAVNMLLSYGVDPFPREECIQWGDILTSSAARRLRNSLMSEYGYVTSSGPDNKLIMYIYRNHMFLQCFSLLKLMFLYGLQVHGADEMLTCNEKCMCRKVVADIQRAANYQLPGTLKMICRTRIRACLGLGVVKKVKTLPLPSRLKRYLCMSDEHCLEKAPI